MNSNEADKPVHLSHRQGQFSQVTAHIVVFLVGIWIYLQGYRGGVCVGWLGGGGGGRGSNSVQIVLSPF